MKPRIRSHLLNFSRLSYVHDDDAPLDPAQILDCSLGINPFGFSPAVLSAPGLLTPEAYSNYPAAYTGLQQALVEYWQPVADISAKQVRLGTGSSGVLQNINRMFVSPGTKVLGYCPQFSEYGTEVLASGGVYDYVPLKWETDYKFNLAEFLQSMNDSYSLIYLDNPNNPTGQVIPLEQVRQIIERAAELNICVIVDEAYGEFMAPGNSAVSLVNKYDNLFVVRTFSKGLGLAGLRIGYTVCSPALLPYYEKVELPFSIASFSYQAAKLAVQDRAFIPQSIAKIKTRKAMVVAACHKLKILTTDPATTIMTLYTPDTTVDLGQVFRRWNVLTEAGRDFLNLGQHAVRLRIPADTDKLIAIISKVEQEL